MSFSDFKSVCLRYVLAYGIVPSLNVSYAQFWSDGEFQCLAFLQAGKTPLDLAKEESETAIAELLEGKMADTVSLSFDKALFTLAGKCAPVFSTESS